METETKSEAEETGESNGNGEVNRWASAARKAPDPVALAYQKVQAVVLEGAEAEWVRLTMIRDDEDAPSLLIEMVGGDVERARGLIDPILPPDIPYEIGEPSTRVTYIVLAVRGVAKLNRRFQLLYRRAVVRAIRAVGGSFSARV